MALLFFTGRESLALTPTPAPTRTATPAATPTPTPTPSTAPVSINAACTLNYIYGDAPYATNVPRTCGMLVTFELTNGTRYYYPGSCLLPVGQRSCSTTISLTQSAHPLPPGATVRKVTVNSEKMNRPLGMEELRGCTYAGGAVQTSPVYNSNGYLIGANVIHQLYCKDYPA